MKTYFFRNNSFKIAVYTVTLLFMAMSFQPQTNSSHGIFDLCSDIGNPGIKGRSVYNPGNDEYTLTGAGENTGSGQDEFHFLSKEVEGDFILTVRVKFIGESRNDLRKTGIMVRNSLSGESAQVNATLRGDGSTSLQFRSKPGNNTEEVQLPVAYPSVLKLERRGDMYIFSAAVYGEPFTVIDAKDLELAEKTNVGIYISSHQTDLEESAVFDNVRLVIPVHEDYVPYREYIGSHIEILDIETGKRKIVHSSPVSLQAPNWTSDSKTLIYNSEGKLFAFDIETSAITEIYTGFAINNNNDHVLSFDGKLLGISDQTMHPKRYSLIYVIPVEGGTPELITKEGPSYLHGFSADDEFMVYTAGRGDYEHRDIYKISRFTKEEVRLTASGSLDDGPEYSPDGKYIYFNSSRTGTMQIWRMKPDGSDQEQMVFDEFNDWFPHISPDGKRMVFISYGTDVKPDDHPFYKHVYIRMMPAEGGDPEVVAYLYGGQGSMNVPSWSPDSRKIAFVSNTKIEEAN